MPEHITVNGRQVPTKQAANNVFTNHKIVLKIAAVITFYATDYRVTWNFPQISSQARPAVLEWMSKNWEKLPEAELLMKDESSQNPPSSIEATSVNPHVVTVPDSMKDSKNIDVIIKWTYWNHPEILLSWIDAEEADRPKGPIHRSLLRFQDAS